MISTKPSFRSLQALFLACLLLSGLPGSSLAKTAPDCTITLLQDTAYVGQPAIARVDLALSIPPEAVSCSWAYRVGPDWQDIPALLEEGQVQLVPWDQGWLKLVVTLTHADGSSSSCSSNTMPVLHPVSPMACEITASPTTTEEGPAVAVTWSVQADPPPRQVNTRWHGSGNQVAQDTEADGLSGSARFLPDKDGKLRFVVEAINKNGQAFTFDSGLILVHTYQNGTRRIVTDAMLKDRVKELAQVCREEAQDAFSQAKWLHDHLARTAFYDHGYTLYDPHGVMLLGTGVCQSFALAYQLLLNEMGIPNKYVTGIGRGGSSMDWHAWNLVQIDSQWYHVDVTWDDQGGHLYFLKSDDYMKKTHSWAYELFPPAPDSYSRAPGK